jgi:4-hydroxy-4-methyl-2-oxoglutarate aldolase
MDQELETLCAGLARLPTAVVSDVLAAMGLPDQVLASTIKPLDPGARIAGPAFCLKGESGPDQPPVAGVSPPVFEMDRRLTPGTVAVIATGGHRTGAVIGGNIGLSFRLKGCVGVVTDGAIRDAAEFAEIGLPLFVTFTTPLSNKGRWHLTEIAVPVSLPGQTAAAVTVAPGDLIQGDGDGVIVIPRRHAAAVLAGAAEVERIESRIKAELRTGEDREAIYRRHDRFGHIKKIAL